MKPPLEICYIDHTPTKRIKNEFFLQRAREREEKRERERERERERQHKGIAAAKRVYSGRGFATFCV